MKITVVIPAYNEQDLLPRTLESLQKQTRQPDEILVVDAKSTDNTARVASSYKNVTVIEEEHKTIGYARESGLKKSSGDVVAFTDADTIVPTDWLSSIEKWLSLPGVVGVFGGFRVYDGAWWYKAFVNILQPFLNTVYFTFFRLVMATGQNMAFYKKTALEVGGFPVEFKIAEDLEIAKRLQSKGKIIFKQNFIVKASGRRGNEGATMIMRVSKAFFYYFVFRRADKIGFPDIRS